MLPSVDSIVSLCLTYQNAALNPLGFDFTKAKPATDFPDGALAWHYSPLCRLRGLVESGFLLPQPADIAARRHEPEWAFFTTSTDLSSTLVNAPHQVERAEGQWARLGYPASLLLKPDTSQWENLMLHTTLEKVWRNAQGLPPRELKVQDYWARNIYLVADRPIDVRHCLIEVTHDNGASWRLIQGGKIPVVPHIEVMQLKWHYVTRQEAQTYLQGGRITPRPVIRFTDQTPDAGAVHSAAGSDGGSGQWMRFGYAGWTHQVNEHAYQAYAPIDVDEFAVIEASDDDGATWRTVYRAPTQ